MTSSSRTLLVCTLLAACNHPRVGTGWIPDGEVETVLLCESRELRSRVPYWATFAIRYPPTTQVAWEEAVLERGPGVVVLAFEAGPEEPSADGSSQRTWTYRMTGMDVGTFVGNTDIGPLKIPVRSTSEEEWRTVSTEACTVGLHPYLPSLFPW